MKLINQSALGWTGSKHPPRLTLPYHPIDMQRQGICLT